MQISSSTVSSFVLGLLIAAGLVGASFIGGNALLSFKAADRFVTVKGLAEREVDANLVIWPISFAEAGNDLLQLHDVMKTKEKAVISFLVTNNLSRNDISTNPPDITDFHAQKYNSGNQSRRYRYLARTTLTIRSENVTAIRELMGRSSELLKQGIVLSGEDFQSRPDYLFTSLNSIKPEMIQEATTNARKAAEQFARDSASMVGQIKSARQGLFSITDRDRNTPYRKKIRVVTSVEYLLIDQ